MDWHLLINSSFALPFFKLPFSFVRGGRRVPTLRFVFGWVCVFEVVWVGFFGFWWWWFWFGFFFEGE